MPPTVEEINKKTYNPNVYYTSLDPQSSSYRNKITKNNKLSSSLSTSRSTKRVNYSLADLEHKLYTQRQDGDENEETSNNPSVLDKFTQQEIIKSKKRHMELDTENQCDLTDVPAMLSSITGIKRDKIESSGGAGTTRTKNKFEMPKNIQLSYRSTKPPVPKKKNTNRIVALKKTLSSRRPLQSYLDTLDQVNKSIIYHNVTNKKFFKVLPVITVCSVCGGYSSISSCVQCGSKICSLRCFNLHNETRCIHR
ncbi:VPS71 (YML041C) [Zygosaccharomyces parabailii]|nr:VPS71 (YML041C) [Zygosaccharomyces parabailii]CDH11971.1 related to Vacuolar protein sorting-associated protein 71 [Zygosaccharomyces bailii ISA1307]